MKAKKLTAE